MTLLAVIHFRRKPAVPVVSDAVVQLGCFAIKVPVGSTGGFSLGDGGLSYPLDNSGTSLASLTGSGVYVDGNDPDTSSGYINEVDDSSTVSLIEIIPPPPKIAITSPTSGQNVNNPVFNVTGTASDNLGLADVYYSLNGSSWAPASTLNNWANWNAVVTLIPGTNAFAAYAIDSSGNVSATSTVNLVYVLNATLAVSTNGLGSLSPNDNNVLLQIGKNYAITAKAGTGFVFTNWTGGTSLPLSILSNSPTVQFVMASNLMLQANFLDVTKPTLILSSPKAGERWSNALFNVSGTASDNWQVSQMLYQLNKGGWASAIGTTNWSASVTLTPGTNSVQVYAVDTTGNPSTTNSVNFDFVVTNRLQIIATGLGSISPNDSNAWLEVGRNYSITAKPASGFVATNWVVSTNGIGGTRANGATVNFLMASNLTLQVNFADVTKPTLSISAPASGQHMTNALATVAGKAGTTGRLPGFGIL